jgi:hypothetical protein
MVLSKQDIILREAVALYKGQRISGGVNWGKVSYHMGGTRSSKQCSKRWHEILKLSDSGLVKKLAWTKDEVSVIHATIIYVLYWLCNNSIALCNVHIAYTVSILYAIYFG